MMPRAARLLVILAAAVTAVLFGGAVVFAIATGQVGSPL
jgi:hypothetical protein